MAEVVTTLNTSTSNLRLSPTKEAEEETAFPGGEGDREQQKEEVGGPNGARREELVVPGGARRESKRELGLPGPGPGPLRRKSNEGWGGSLNTQPRRFSEHRLKVADSLQCSAVQCSAVQCISCRVHCRALQCRLETSSCLQVNGLDTGRPSPQPGLRKIFTSTRTVSWQQQNKIGKC